VPTCPEIDEVVGVGLDFTATVEDKVVVCIGAAQHEDQQKEQVSAR
jgi:hypothetical protein